MAGSGNDTFFDEANMGIPEYELTEIVSNAYKVYSSEMGIDTSN